MEVADRRRIAMKAAVVRELGQPLVIEERPVPTPAAGQVLVRLETSGLCHTDIHAADGDWPVKPVPPFVPGHEGVGRIEAVGDGVSSQRVGERVAIPWLHAACGTCEFCVSGWETLCLEQKNTVTRSTGVTPSTSSPKPTTSSRCPKVSIRSMPRR
jgi:propanol-preferring alcohol dehydrogenase